MSVLLPVLLSVLLSWGLGEVTAQPLICPVEEMHNGKVVHVPYECSEVLVPVFRGEAQ